MYTQKAFEGCLFNPLVKDKMLSAYPSLSQIVTLEMAAVELLDEVLRYVVLLYDPKSALVIGERDLNHRKSTAAELAGFDMDEEQLLDSIYRFDYPHLPELAMKYLMRFGKSKEWAAICAFEFKYWESIRKIMEPIACKTIKEELEAVQKKAMISDEIDKDIERLDKYYKNFFGSDDELEKKAKKRVTPELVAGKKQ